MRKRITEENDDTNDDDTNSSSRPVDSVKIQNARTNMALVHFIMTAPKWSISLFLFLAARQRPILSFESAVQKPMEHLRVAFAMESQAYQECAVNVGSILQYELQLVAQKEYDRVTKVHEKNEDWLHRAGKQSDQCFVAAKNARDLLVDWKDQGYSVDLVGDETVCNVSQRKEIEGLLGGETQLLKEEVTSTWDNHVEESLRGFHLIRDYAQARIQYDYDYFVGLRIRPALEFISNLPSVDIPSLSLDQAFLQARLSGPLEGLRRALNEVEEILKALKARIEELTKSVDDFYAAYLALYNRLLKASAFVADFLPPGAPLPPFFDLSGIPLAESMLPSYIDLNALDVDMKALYSLVDEAAQACTSIILDVVNELNDQAKRALLGALDHINDSLIALLTLDDYDPPMFVGSQPGSTSMTDEVNYQEKIALMAVNNTKEILARLSSMQASGASVPKPNFTLDGPEDTTAEETTTFDHLRPIFPSISVPNIIAFLVSLLSSYLWLFELAVQAVRLWKLEAMYSKAAIPDLPEISYESQDQEEEQPNRSEAFLLICMKIFLNPRMIVGAIIAPILLLVVAVWYPHLNSNCVESRNGTSLAKHFVAPIMINKANALGNTYYLEAEFQCRKTESALCQQLQAQTLTSSAGYRSSFSDMNANFDASSQALSLIASCVHHNTKDAIRDSCCGIKGFESCDERSSPGYCPFHTQGQIPMAFRPLHEYLSEGSCVKENWHKDALLEPSIDCLKLKEVCDMIPCLGVNKASLRAETVETDCGIQLYTLDSLVFAVLTVFNAVAVNVVGTLLFNGFRSVAWRKLHPEGIRMKAMLKENGRLATGEDREDRLQRISVAITRFEFAGKLQIVSGVLLLLLWLFLAFG